MNDGRNIFNMFDDAMGCFGGFDANNRICRQLCALRLRCAIERNQSDRLEILEDLVEADGMYQKLQ